VGPRGFGLAGDQLASPPPVSWTPVELRPQAWRRGDRGHHLLHQHLQPQRAGGAGLLAKKAVERGLDVKPWVKTSLAPGSQVVTRYLDAAGLTPYLEALNFHTVGYGCTTCIGNSGPLPEPISKGDQAGRPGRRGGALGQPQLRGARQPGCARQLPRLAAAGRRLRHRRHHEHRPGDGAAGLRPQRQPGLSARCLAEIPPLQPIQGARVLAFMADSTTTDHISPAGNIAPGSPAARYLEDRAVPRREWNSYGSRRGNHEVMMRGTYANIRIKNQMLPGVEGGVTRYIPTGETLAIWDAAEKYMADGTPLVVLAGKEYGTGSSRDWAAKGVQLQGVRAVIAESFERIHRSNLVGMGVLPLQFLEGESARSLGLTGYETYDILGLSDTMEPRQHFTVRATRDDGSTVEFAVMSRIDTPVEVNYYRNGGILQTVLRRMAE
jgi:aconitase A